ncbi:hypothetical protein [Pseudomonas amygdali]|nr:hypothetical protein [Pseudomonas amygdali]
MLLNEYTTYTTLRSLPIAELANPEHRPLLLWFAREIAVPCVAEAFMNILQHGSQKSVPIAVISPQTPE